MPADRLRVLLIGDVIGRYGRRFLKSALPQIRQKYAPDLVIANGENSAGGLGIITRTAEEIFAAGVDLITSGNHVWDKKEALELLKREPRILRPLNFPAAAPGRGFATLQLAGGGSLTVINLQGRVFMEPVVDNPFTAMDDFLKQHELATVLVDFHAEATAEKQALGFFLDGRVSAVLGTHTHVPTADACILPKGTAYQTDVGLTGSSDSIIGMEREVIIRKFVSGIGGRFEVAKDNLVLDMTRVDIESGQRPGAGHRGPPPLRVDL